MCCFEQRKEQKEFNEPKKYVRRGSKEYIELKKELEKELGKELKQKVEEGIKNIHSYYDDMYR
mgnify:FL=1